METIAEGVHARHQAVHNARHGEGRVLGYPSSSMSRFLWGFRTCLQARFGGEAWSTVAVHERRIGTGPYPIRDGSHVCPVHRDGRFHRHSWRVSKSIVEQHLRHVSHIYILFHSHVWSMIARGRMIDDVLYIRVFARKVRRVLRSLVHGGGFAHVCLRGTAWELCRRQLYEDCTVGARGLPTCGL